MAYRGNVFNQRGCPMVHQIKGKLYAKNQGPDSKEEKVICLWSNFETDRQTLCYAIKRDLLVKQVKDRYIRVHRTLGRLQAKIKDLNQDIRKLLVFLGNYDRQTDRPSDGHEGS